MILNKKKQFNQAKKVNQQAFNNENVKKLVNSLHGLRLRTEAHAIVDTYDDLMLYSEKIRRIMIRVKVRCNRACKKSGWRLLKSFIELCHKKKSNNIKAIAHLEKILMKQKRNCYHKILKLNDFERNWIFNVRFELYYCDIVSK
jgi:hypothetical protein